MNFLPQHPCAYMQHYQAHRSQMRFQVRKLMIMITFDFYVKLIKFGILLYSLSIQHHLKVFTSASNLKHATLPSAPSSDGVTSRATHDHDNLRVLRETD